MTTTLVLVRHGHTVASNGRCVGHYETALSERGAEVLHRLAAS